MADNEREFTTVFKADISDFDKSTQDLNRYVRQVNSEFNNATAGMGKWSDSTDGLKAKLTQLSGVLQAEEKKLGDLKGRYAELVAQGKQNTKEAQNLATSINNQQASVTKINDDIAHYTRSLKELEDAGVNTRQELEATTKANEDLKQSLNDISSGALKGAVAGLAGIATACVGALAGLNSLVNDTQELRTQMGQLETAFGAVGFSAETATKTYGELNAVLGDSGQATEASQHLAQLATSEEELQSLTHSLTGVYAQFGSSLPLESLAESASVTATLGEVNGSFADVLEFAGHSVDDFNVELEKCTTEQERSQLITKTLNDIYGDSATKYKELNKDVIEANRVQDNYNQAMADIAEVAQPAITQFKTAMVGVLQTILEKFKEVDIEALVKKIADAISNLTEKVLPPLIAGIEWVLDNLNWLAPLLATIAGAIGAISLAMKAYTAIANIAKVAQIAWNVAMTANPIGLIITAIGALIAIIVLLVKNWDEVKEAGAKAWDGIKKVWENVSKWFKEKVIDPVVKFFKENWQTILLFMVNPIAGAFKLIYEKSEGFRNFINGILKTVGDFFKNTFSQIGKIGASAWDGLKNGAQKAWDGIKSVFSKVGTFFKDTFTKAWQSVKNVFQTGGKIFDGIKDGIVSTFKNIVNGIITGINKVVATPFNSINTILSRLKGIEVLNVKPFKWVGTISVPSIPKLAKGGVIDKATLAMVGEAGKEAVLPLENNTGWIRDLAKQISGAGGGANYTINQNFAGMKTTALEQHKAKIELMRALKYGGV